MQSFIGTRTTLQIRSHAQKYFINWQKKDGTVSVNEKGFTQKCVNELLKKLKHDDNDEVSVSELPKYINKKEKGIFLH